MSKEIVSFPAPFIPFSLNCRGRLFAVDKPVVMGILNVSPDSFFDGGKFTEESSILEKAAELIAEGAQIIDIGAVSSKPGAHFITEDEEWKRLAPALELVVRHYPGTLISVDTWRAAIARKAIERGAHIINDISGGQFDVEMYSTVARLGVPYILMHIQGSPENMQHNPNYADVVSEVFHYFSARIDQCRQAGIKDLIIDPGFGFGKTLEHNYRLLSHLSTFQTLGCPLLAGVSRKSMINKVLGITAAESLNGTTVLNTLALMHGAALLRVHDARQAREAIQLIQQYRQAM